MRPWLLLRHQRTEKTLPPNAATSSTVPVGYDLLALDLFLLLHFQFCHCFLLHLAQATLTFSLSVNHPVFVPNAEPSLLPLPLPGTDVVHHCNQHSYVSGPGSPALITVYPFTISCPSQLLFVSRIPQWVISSNVCCASSHRQQVSSEGSL